MEKPKIQRIIKALKEYEEGASAKKISKEYGVSVSYFYKWRKLYGKVETTKLDRVMELEEENRRLIAENASLAQDLKMAKEAIEKKP